MSAGKYDQPTVSERLADRAERKEGAAERLRAASGSTALERAAKAAGYALVPVSETLLEPEQAEETTSTEVTTTPPDTPPGD